MKKGLKIFLIVVLVGLVGGLGTVYYVFNKPHRDVENEAPAFTMEASQLYDEFSSEEDASNAKYGDQVIQVNGDIAEISNDGFTVSIMLGDAMAGVNCAMDSATVADNKAVFENLKEGEAITLKGKCDGFDMIMGVVLTRCFIIE